MKALAFSFSNFMVLFYYPFFTWMLSNVNYLAKTHNTFKITLKFSAYMWWAGAGLQRRREEQPQWSLQHVVRGTKGRLVSVRGKTDKSAVCSWQCSFRVLGSIAASASLRDFVTCWSSQTISVYDRARLTYWSSQTIGVWHCSLAKSDI